MKMTFEGKKLYSVQKKLLAEFRDGLWMSPDGKCLFIIRDTCITNITGETIFRLERERGDGTVKIIDKHHRTLVKQIKPDGRVLDACGRLQGVLR